MAGLTLIELMVVIAIIGIVLAIVMPRILASTCSARAIALLAELKKCATLFPPIGSGTFAEVLKCLNSVKQKLSKLLESCSDKVSQGQKDDISDWIGRLNERLESFVNDHRELTEDQKDQLAPIPDPFNNNGEEDEDQ